MAQQRMAHIVGLQSRLVRRSGKALSAASLERLRAADGRRLFKTKSDVLVAQTHLSMIHTLKQRMQKIDKTIPRQVRPQDEFRKLLTVPGLMRVHALVIMLETGNINRFARVSHYGAFCRLAQRRGAEKRPRTSPHLFALYMELAWNIQKRSPEARRWFQDQLVRTDYPAAMRALAARLAKACYFIIKDQRDFMPGRIFG